MTTIICKRSEDVVIAIDVIYSPDDRGYYLEKSVIPDNEMMRVYHSDIYADKSSIIQAYKKSRINWTEV